jgi:osmotically-inducible protein OsmY
VWSALTGDPRTRSANIRVAADCADVLITGSADNARALDAISEVAGGVAGVASVENEVGVGGHWQCDGRLGRLTCRRAAATSPV